MQQEQDSISQIVIEKLDTQASTLPEVVKVQVADTSLPEVKRNDSTKKTIQKKVSIGQPKTSKQKQLLVAAPENFIEKNIAEQTIALDSAHTSSEFSPELAPKVKPTAAWEILVLIVAIFLIAFVKAFNKRRVDLLIKAFINNNSVTTTLREERVFSNQAVWLLLVAFLLTISIYITDITSSWMPDIVTSYSSFFLKTLLFVFLVYVIKFSVLELISELIDTHKAIHEYIFNVILFNIVAGIIILPFILYRSVSLGDHPWVMNTSLFLLAILYLYRNWRLIQISFKFRFSIYYIFLYLCTLEILPGIILIKLLQTQ